MKIPARVLFSLILTCAVMPFAGSSGETGGDTVWVSSTWFLTNPNAGRAVRDMPYDTVDVDTSILTNFSWNDERRTSYFTGDCSYPSMDVSGNSVHIAYNGQGVGDRPEIFHQLGSAGGHSWSDSLLLSEIGEPRYSGMPTLKSCDSLVYVAWDRKGPSMYSRDVRMRKSYDAGTTWGDPIIIQEDIWSDYVPYWIKLCLSVDTVLCTYTRRYSDGNFQRFRWSLDQGNNWTDERTVSYDGAGSPASIDYGGGLISITQGQSLEVYYYSSTDFGETWSSGLILSTDDVEASQWPVLACDGKGGIYVTWFDYLGSPHATTGYILLRRSIDWGETWEPIVSLSTLPTGMESHLYADSHAVYAIWRDERQGIPNQDIYFRMSTDMGVSWSPEMRVDDAEDLSRMPFIVAHNERVHVSWVDGIDGDWSIYYRMGGPLLPGDADDSGAVDIDDAVYLISYIFAGGPPPILSRAGDTNCNGELDIDDVVYLILFIFAGGPPPC